MSEWRHDPLTGRWVLIAPERALRPHADRRAAAVEPLGFDPFAEGAEDETTPETLAIRDPLSAPNGPGWQVRAIVNKYPAVRPGPEGPLGGVDWFRAVPGRGVHDVIIECPQSETHLSRLPVEQIELVLRLYRDRLAMLRREARWAYALVFKNHGRDAGATLSHAHAQLLAIPFVPTLVADEVATARRHWAATGRSFFTDWLTREQAAGVRMIHESAAHAAFCPFASRFPFEMCVLPRQPAAHFDAVSDEQLADLAPLVKMLLQRLEIVAHDPPYNLVLRTAPFDLADDIGDSWRLEILPRIGRLAGYELGTGWFINPQTPEAAAERLRE